jgi:hypothetical protein
VCVDNLVGIPYLSSTDESTPDGRTQCVTVHELGATAREAYYVARAISWLGKLEFP